MRNSFSVYSPNVLAGFIYPSKYLEISADFTEIANIPFLLGGLKIVMIQS